MTKTKEIGTLRAELEGLGVAAAEGIEAAAKVKELEAEVKRLTEENKVLNENYNSERVRNSYILYTSIIDSSSTAGSSIEIPDGQFLLLW